MDQEIWQQLLSLESRDITQEWFSKIHGRKLSARRAKEINAAAKQSREYFRNASNSNYSVRPLLTYYGVASLTRSLVLLLMRSGGEESLASGHGLTTLDWGKQLLGGETEDVQSLFHLKVQTSSGLFSDLIRETKNRISIHINSARVDWRLNYDEPPKGLKITLSDLLARTPDLLKDYSQISSDIRYAYVSELSFDRQDGFKVKVSNEHFKAFEYTYKNMGYSIDTQDKWSILTCDATTFENKLPLFIHTYVQKMFGSIPTLYIADPFPGEFTCSQLAVTYMWAYFLGMLARYFPTRWISLIQGDKGDALWPTLNRAQQFVEYSYPELVIEIINDMLKETANKGSER